MVPPPKRNISSILTTQTLLDFDLEESSSDSDFRIEDHDDDSDDYSLNSGKENKNDNGDNSDGDDDDSSDDSDSGSSEPENILNDEVLSTNELLDIVKKKEPGGSSKVNLKLPTTPICCACLGDRSDDTNEIVECDGCGVTVHEGCYGVSDSVSVSSTVSSCTTEPWFCEACKAGVTSPVCELCPNKGGIYKETDVGKWVHLVCALYIPGVAFGEVDQLSSVTLFEMQYSKWGSKTCSLCEDPTFARTGVCIGCDAGMCKNYFHVTCAQSNGFLSEAHSEEVDHADPFYAHCKLHSDKTLIKKRKRNFNAFKMKMDLRARNIEELKHEKPTAEQLRIERKLRKHKTKYLANKGIKTEPWVPTQKMPRLLTTSASARRRLLYKAKLMGIDTPALELQESQIASLVDVRKKWHIPPAFSIEFIAYYLDRIVRLNEIKNNLNVQIESNKKLLGEQQNLREKYDEKMVEKQDTIAVNANLKTSISNFHSCIQSLCSNKILPQVDTIGKSPVAKPQNLAQPPAKTMTVPTAAALKMGVGFPLNNLHGTTNNTGRVLSTQHKVNDALLHDCGICKKFTDQHLLAKCDTCHFYYHLGCLNPPLTRHPKKSKLYGWQCSECDKSDDSEPDITLPKAQRRSRVRYSKDGIISDPLECSIPLEDISVTDNSFTSSMDEASKSNSTIGGKVARKRTKKLINTQNKKPSLPQNATDSLEKSKIETANFVDEIDANVDLQPVVELDPLQLDDEKPTPQSPTPAPVASGSPLESSLAQSTEPQAESTPKLLKEKRDKKNKKSKKIMEFMQSDNDNDTSNLPQFTSEIITDTTGNLAGGSPSHYKPSRKRKKDKHKSKYSSDSEKSPYKEHKRKHKRKDLDKLPPTPETGPHPRIKIKFKAIHMPGTDKANSEPKFIAVPSVSEAVTENVIKKKSLETPKSPAKIASPPPVVVLSPKIVVPKLIPARRKSIAVTSSNRKELMAAVAATAEKGSACDVCHEPGTPQNTVCCDECRKNYHFSCLDPPVKKSPKRRGYSWHCADCDPTDVESN